MEKILTSRYPPTTSLYMIWADRVAIAWWVLLIVIMEMMWAAPHPMLLDSDAWRIFFFIVGIPWIALRCIAFVISGVIGARR